MFDPMADLQDDAPVTDDASTSSDDSGHSEPERNSRPPRQSHGGGGRGNYAQELHSVTIHAKQRTFYIDLKESSNGKFFKLSEKSRGGQKTTIMFDSEDLEPFIGALTEMRDHI